MKFWECAQKIQNKPLQICRALNFDTLSSRHIKYKGKQMGIINQQGDLATQQVASNYSFLPANSIYSDLKITRKSYILAYRAITSLDWVLG